MYFKLPDHEVVFPNPALADEDGLLAVGGDLSLERLLLAYANGIFPWFSEGDPILWYAPKQRCVIFPEKIKISKSMHKILNNNTFQITVNECFADVVEACATINRAGQEGTWITQDMQQAYLNLHKNGFAHSIEVWQNSYLAGGLYGVKINRVFCGESMFSRISNASKTALIFLCNNFDIGLIDCQLPNEHLLNMGAEMMEMQKYLSFLK